MICHQRPNQTLQAETTIRAHSRRPCRTIRCKVQIMLRLRREHVICRRVRAVDIGCNFRGEIAKAVTRRCLTNPLQEAAVGRRTRGQTERQDCDGVLRKRLKVANRVLGQLRCWGTSCQAQNGGCGSRQRGASSRGLISSALPTAQISRRADC